MKHKFVLAILILLYVIASPTACLAAGSASASPDHVTLTWADNPATTMTVTWRTDNTTATGSVEYQKYQKSAAFTANAKYATSHSADFTTDLQATHLFTATLKGLEPNTKYLYRVGNQGHWSANHSFTTANPSSKSFKFLVFGDSQSVADGNFPYGVWSKTLHNAYSANPDARFFVNMGDLVDTGQSGAHWNAWFSAAAGVIDTIPIMPVVGNHETRGSLDTRRPAYWKAQFYLPQNGPSDLKDQAYSYDYGPVHFVVLDSQQSEEKQYGDILTPQKKWLAADLAASKSPWKIVFLHKSAYSLMVGRENKDIRNAFCPVYDRYHVDVVFNGHDHSVGRTFPIKNEAYMSKPSQGTIYYSAGRSGTKYYNQVCKRDWSKFFYNPTDQPDYLVVEVAGAKLTITALKTDGAIIDEFFIDKKKDINSDTSHSLGKR
ncbi:MAG: metallophosphoesterase family protein [Armatimonadota bacterium]